MTLIPRTGQSRFGHPLSDLRVPPADLAPFIARFFITIIDAPATQYTEDFLLNETGFVRVLVRGEWQGWVGDGWQSGVGPIQFGAQSRPLRVRARGSMAVAGFAIRPGGWFGLESASADTYADRFVEIAGDWGAALTEAARDVDDRDATYARLEAIVRARVAQLGAPHHAAMAQFETMARIEPAMPVADAAAALGFSPRHFDRLVRAHFGHVPKTVLRRSRFLDIAAVMRGFAVPDADELADMRFYDASHLNREFRHFTGMTPNQFKQTATPLLTPGLMLRQHRKMIDQGIDSASAT